MLKVSPTKASQDHTAAVVGDRAALLLAWYDRHRRVLPWRARAGERSDPYRVWLSEIMLQQTTVKAVGPYFEKFVARWPTVDALGKASLDDVLRMWAGLGYYSRARNLHACAAAVMREHGGQFPDSEEGLRALPGVGPYTAAAIAAIAFDHPTMPVDGNIERVVSRLFAVEDELPKAKPRIQALAQTLLPADRAGDAAQALMDLGATICTPKKPACVLCPFTEGCTARARGDQEIFPRKAPKKTGAVRRGRCVRRHARSRGAGSHASRKRPARRHDGGADLGLARRPGGYARAQAGAEACRPCAVAAQARRRHACVHAFSAGACRLHVAGAGANARAGGCAVGCRSPR